MEGMTAAPERPDRLAPERPVPPAPDGPAHRLRRDSDRALLAGVCSGIADRLGIDPIFVRIAFIAGAVAGGWGIVLYLLIWAFVPAEEGEGGRVVGRLVVGRRGWQVAVGMGLLVLGVMLAVRKSGLWFGDALVWPVVLAAGGAALIWRQSQAGAEDEARTSSTWRSDPEAPPRPAPTPEPPLIASVRMAAQEVRRVVGASGPASGRATLGVALVIAAGIAFLWLNNALRPARDVLLAILVVIVAAALILAPWWLRLVRGLAAERTERIRSQERAEMAAHLHDSVLQTLAMVQRRADDPREVAGLARRQERELRAWLNGGRLAGQQTAATLAAALEATAVEVEETLGVPVDVVAVGDIALDEPGEAVVAAVREALVNAAKFAGGGPVSVYAEVDDDRIEVFVRDRGPGFDLEQIPLDRRGVRESILGRMERHGGRARVHTAPGGGTEVELVVERR
jgi:signal transduction histidine kinase/phage shock protein PspC (stress-responsive transcriptional regulator)